MSTGMYTTTNFNIVRSHAYADETLRLVKVAEDFRRFLGTEQEYQSLYNIIDPADAPVLKEKMLKIDDESTVYLSTKLHRADNVWRDVSLRIILLPADMNSRHKYSIEMIDTHNSYEYIYDMEFNSIKYKKILETFGNVFFQYNYETDELCFFLLKYNTEELLRKIKLSDLIARNNIVVHPDDEAAFSTFCTALKNNETFFEVTFKHSPFENDAPAENYVLYGSTVILDEGLTMTVGCVNSKTKISSLSSLNSLDMMTGLLNKKAILDLAKNAIDNKKYEQAFIGIVDLDNFKLVNDNYGHMKGDNVIKKVANILKSEVRKHGWVGRFGGDEFLIFLHDLGAEGDLRAILGSIFTNIEEAYKDKFDGFNLSCSIGIAEYPRNGDNFDLLFKKADRGVYIAKQKGKKRYIIYKEEMHGDITLDSVNDDYVAALDTQKFAGDIKCYSIIRDGLANIATNGNGAIDNFMQEIINTYALVGISIYAGNDFKLFRQWGKYSSPMPSADYLNDPVALVRYNQKDILWENNVDASGFFIPIIHNELLKHNIKSTVQALIRRNGEIIGLMCFDKEQSQRNWTEDDTHHFGIVAQIVGSMLIK